MEEVKWRSTSGGLAITLNLGLEDLTISHVEPLRPPSRLAAFVGLAFFLYRGILRGPEESWPQAEEWSSCLWSLLAVEPVSCILAGLQVVEEGSG